MRALSNFKHTLAAQVIFTSAVGKRWGDCSFFSLFLCGSAGSAWLDGCGGAVVVLGGMWMGWREEGDYP